MNKDTLSSVSGSSFVVWSPPVSLSSLMPALSQVLRLLPCVGVSGDDDAKDIVSSVSLVGPLLFFCGRSALLTFEFFRFSVPLVDPLDWHEADMSWKCCVCGARVSQTDVGTWGPFFHIMLVHIPSELRLVLYICGSST